MIKYKLICKNCKLSFDSWFASSIEYEKLKKKNFLNCHNCNSSNIEKTLMAPKLMNKSNKVELKTLKPLDINKKLKEYKKFINDNFEFVGDNFAYEARSIHYKEKKKEKGIYGTASKKEIKELKDEGINAEMIPWVEDGSN
tara:strand:+ start:1278 stop:1700 length:423 start_codon:yes stop_codon:yes gene_type:complete